LSPSVVATDVRSGRWLEDPGFGVYVHIPFCMRRCAYCDFNTYEGQRELHEVYVDALVKDISRRRTRARPVTSVFFGGGTPTLLSPRALARVLRAVADAFPLEPDAEVTVEANPETVAEGTFEHLLDAGFNRFSVGVQSLAPRVLRALGRTHSAERALQALAAARRAGVDDLNADLIYGSPWESERDWAATLEGVVEATPDHISAYALTVEEGTPLATLVSTGRVEDVDPDVQADRFAIAADVLGAAGYTRYETSNWARPSRASRHNVLYWSAGDYLGFGAGAHSHVAGRRWWEQRLPRAYVSAVEGGRPSEAGGERLPLDDRAGEAFALGLRLASGVDLAGLARRYGSGAVATRAPAITELEGLGLVERRGSSLRLSPQATLVANEIACRLL
jgi:oxygen-independent coproporphyrinogen-3 oxidase